MGFSAHSFSARFWSLIGATFLGFLGIGTVLPGLAPHIRHDLGGSDQTVGFVIGIFSFVALASRFVSGPLADRRGRKITFLLGLASCGLAGGAYLLPLGISGAYLGRILQGFGEACLYTGAAAWAVELGGIQRGAQALGYVSSGIWGGISAGPVVGQWLGSFRHAALFQMIAATIAVALLSQIEEDYKPGPHLRRKAWIPRSLIAPGVAVGFVNVHYPVITGLPDPAFGSAWQLRSSGLFGIRPPDSAVALLSGRAAGSHVARHHVLRRPRRHGGRSDCPVHCSIARICNRRRGASRRRVFLPWSSVAGTVLRNTPEGERGSVVGLLSAFYDLFVGVSSFTAGAIADHFGYSAAFVMAAISIAAAAFVGRSVFGEPATRQLPEHRRECEDLQAAGSSQ